jgi:hypothetical protein
MWEPDYTLRCIEEQQTPSVPRGKRFKAKKSYPGATQEERDWHRSLEDPDLEKMEIPNPTLNGS